ncbi:MAG: MmgE/PrpD family protein [Anaerolineae bacterium]|jgi:2-methylcitrate dehydratase PrpD
MDGNDLVANFIHALTWESLQPAVQDRIRLALLDTLGATLVGTLTPISAITAEYATATWPGDEATILLHNKRASAIGAAFSNGYAANGIDIDDCALYTKGHPGAQIFPTALALAESLQLGGAAMMTAMVIGYEVAHRAARIWHETHEVYQACGSWGSVACAAIAAHLLRLPPWQIQHALGIAEYHAPNLPMMRDIDDPTMVKHGIGWGTMTGITAAQLAARGFTGIPSLFGFQEYAGWVDDIGRHYIMANNIAWKGYACCAWDHAAMRAAGQLVAAHQIQVADIARIDVEAPHVTLRLGTRLPTTTEEAQFNLAWPLAALLLDGEVGPAQILEERFDDPRLRDLAGRVSVVETDELNDLYRRAERGDLSGCYAAIVTITLKDGQSYRSDIVEGNINFPQEGWDAARVEGKFRWLTGQVLDEARVAQLVDLVARFEQVPDVRELTSLIAAAVRLSSRRSLNL